MSNDPPKRRWYQFSLKTLLVVITVATVAFGGWVQYRRFQARVNRERVEASENATKKAVAAIEKLGGIVTSEREELRPQTWLEEQFDDPGRADDPVGVLEVTKVEFRYDSHNITDAELEHLKGLTALEELYIQSTNVTDAGLQQLKGLLNLQRLHLYGTKVTDAGLEHLKGLTIVTIVTPVSTPRESAN